MTEVSCLQYKYTNEEDAKKFKIDCKDKIFDTLDSLEKYNSRDMLSFVDENYSEDAFPSASGESPFTFKDTYISLSNQEICVISDRTLTPPQKFLGQIMGPSSNFRNLLMFHGLGSGKTCSAIVIAQALKNLKTRNKVIFAVPAPLIEQYYEEILGSISKDGGSIISCPNFCLRASGKPDTYITDIAIGSIDAKIIDIDILDNEIKTLIKSDKSESKRYAELVNRKGVLEDELTELKEASKTEVLKTFTIVSHQLFINYISGSFPIASQKPKKGHEDDTINYSGLFVEDGLLIIDEVQRLVSAKGKFYNKLYSAVKYFFHPRLRIVLLTATPVYDNPYELALTINLLRPRVPFPLTEKEFYKKFIGKYVAKEKEDGTKYLACVESDEYKTFVRDDSCLINRELISYICSGYVSYFKGGNPNAYPTKRTINMEHIFSAEHKAIYIEAVISDTKEDVFPDERTWTYENVLLGNFSEEDDTVDGVFTTSQQCSNIGLRGPPGTENIVIKTIAEKKQALFRFENDLRVEKSRGTSELQLLEYIKKYSVKFVKIVELTNSCNGPVFIFSNWLTYGVDPLAIIFKAIGYKLFDGSAPVPGENRYFVWSSETKSKDKNLVSNARRTFSSIENINGSHLKVILGTRSVMEGVSFKHVKQVHITDPWWNESRINQIIARAVRYCSHSDLPLEEQYVDVYRHFSVYSSVQGIVDEDIKERFKEKGLKATKFLSLTIDQVMTSTSKKKHELNVSLERLLKNCSIDVNINKNGNIKRLEEEIFPLQSGNYSLLYYDNVSNRHYKRIGEEFDGDLDLTLDTIVSRSHFITDVDNLTFQEVYDDGGWVVKKYSNPSDGILKTLNVVEKLTPWSNDKVFEDLEIFEADAKKNKKQFSPLMEDTLQLYSKMKLIPLFRKQYFNETVEGNRIKFAEFEDKKMELFECVRKFITDPYTRKELQKIFNNDFISDIDKSIINNQIIDLIKWGLFTPGQEEELKFLATTERPTFDIMYSTLKTQREPRAQEPRLLPPPNLLPPPPKSRPRPRVLFGKRMSSKLIFKN